MSKGASAEAERIPLVRARLRLARLWLVGAGVLALPLMVQSILGAYGDRVHEAWAWFIPTVLPTVALMVGVLGAGALAGNEQRTVDRNYYQISWWLSLVYLGAIALTLLLEPMRRQRATIELYMLSNYWLGPIQGIVLAATGVLFAAQKDKRGK